MTSSEKILAGLDIGGTKLAAGLVDTNGRVLLEKKTPTVASEGGPAVLARGLSLVEELIEEGQHQGLGRPAGIGLAVAGRIDVFSGKVAGSSNLIPDWTGLALTAAFEDKFDLPCRADNDVNAIALAEQRFGAGQGFSDALFVAAGTGLGGGLIIGGKLEQGAHFCSGEIGHTTIAFEGWPCECGRLGCLEQYTATAALKRFFREYAPDFPKDEPLTIEDLTRQAITKPDGPAAAAFGEAGRMLGLGLASLVRICDPQVIIIGGGLVLASSYYFTQTRATFQAQAWPAQNEIPVVLAQLGGLAGIIGAALLVFEARFS